MRRAVSTPSVTAGLKCPPEMWPKAYAPVTTVRPKASDTPSNPMPRLVSGMKLAASTTAPQPASTSHKVPSTSAISLRCRDMAPPGETVRARHTYGTRGRGVLTCAE
jgi:hypothetical protein